MQVNQRHRPTEQVTLDEIATLVFQKLVLLKRFDALGHHL
jgi:hypothetical protein